MKTVRSLSEIRGIDNIDYVEQEVEVQIKGCTSIYTFTIERDRGGNISDILELQNKICCDSEDVLIDEILVTADCMWNVDQEWYDANTCEKNKSIINKEDIDIYRLADDDIEFLRKIGDDETIILLWKIIENRVYFEDEE